jgi:hypothetical protein
MQTAEKLINLYFIQTQTMFGEPIVELWASHLSLEELNDLQDDYFPYLGTLDNDTANDMIEKGYETGNEEECIQYAKEVKQWAIPETYNLIIHHT